MRLRNDTRIRPERPQIPETPETPQSEDPVVPWVKDEVPKKKSPRFLEDILAEEVMYPVCRTLWHILLSPLWQWTLRPTLWESPLRPFLWQRIIRQGVWEGISQQILWEGVLQQILFEGILQSFLGEKMSDVEVGIVPCLSGIGEYIRLLAEDHLGPDTAPCTESSTPRRTAVTALRHENLDQNHFLLK
ncbi:hypothetical protein FSPOR_6724 [Fusarium sporotrichioides]|uniref:Uncharacterized protein n=1 Tax=Fusarium sporotrichioides TaxID=5514 RepID=A0A395S1Q0_FUSSP|nr:hypothetical protein FSPOR_6724 [Fusarium sporotrichioides]